MPKKTNKPKKNPTDPIKLALEVVEAAIKEPLSPTDIIKKKSNKPKKNRLSK